MSGIVHKQSDADFLARVTRNRQNRMARIDAMPPALRECVHDYGLHVVDTLLDLGVTKPKHIRHVVEAVLNEFSPTRGATNCQRISLTGLGE